MVAMPGEMGILAVMAMGIWAETATETLAVAAIATGTLVATGGVGMPAIVAMPAAMGTAVAVGATPAGVAMREEMETPAATMGTAIAALASPPPALTAPEAMSRR
jgi:hypothetical protein